MQDPSTDINFVNFNQDCSSLAIGTRTGYKLLSLSSVDKLELIYESACRYRMLLRDAAIAAAAIVSLLPVLIVNMVINVTGTSPLLKDSSPPPFLP